jgi:Tfp pilus assembly protein PilN
MEKELARAVELQVDSLHPFEEGGVYWDFATEGAEQASGWSWRQRQPAPEGAGRLDVVVAIARKESVEELAEWFQKAGIPVSQFGVTATVLLGLLRQRQKTWSGAVFLADGREAEWELVGTAPGKPAVSKEVQYEAGAASEEARWAAMTEELDRARAEMRVAPEERPLVLVAGTGIDLESAAAWGGEAYRFVAGEEALPAEAAGKDFPVREHIAAAAAALGAVRREHLFGVNLLPAARRVYQSPMAMAPTYALAGVVVVLAMALGLRGSAQDWMYGRHLERERRALEPQIQQLEQLQAQNRRIYQQLTVLTALGESAGTPLELLEELTELLPGEAWLQSVQYEGNSVTLAGTAPSASAVLQALATSGRLESPQFLSAITRTQDGQEGFRIGARLRAAGR